VLSELACTQDRALSIYEAARDKARAIAKTEAYAVIRCQRKKVEMLFAHLKRILGLDRLRLRGPNGAKDEFVLAATAQNLRKLAKLIPLPAPYSPHEAARLNNFASPAAAAGANSATSTRGFSTLSVVSGSCAQMLSIP
jgi:Transposase DDE domain